METIILVGEIFGIFKDDLNCILLKLVSLKQYLKSTTVEDCYFLVKGSRIALEKAFSNSD